MPKKRQTLRRVYLRDDKLCGIHLGGCGKEILPGQNYNRDHIIPRSLFRKVSRGRENEFEQDWNCQPMHEDCNSSKSFQLDGWPRFGCECHYLQVVEDDLYVCTRGKIRLGSHKLLSSVVSDFPESPDRVDARVIVGHHKDTQDQRFVGFRKDRYGYVLPGIHAHQVEMFNLHERARVGLPRPERIKVDHLGRITHAWGMSHKRISSHDHVPTLHDNPLEGIIGHPLGQQ